MKLTITIDLDNAAFVGSSRYDETRRILDYIPDCLDLGTAGDIKLRDRNGNPVGKAEVTDMAPHAESEASEIFGAISRELARKSRADVAEDPRA